MFSFILKGLFWFVAMMVALAILVTHAQAQPPTYLPWQAGVTHRVIQGNGGSYSHNTAYTRYGWDFNLASGTPVLSAAPGRVTIAAGGWNGGWGNTVTVCYGDGTCSRYGHLSWIGVGSGQSVGQGQLIGRSGTTGNSSGPHLHYQLENGSGISLSSRFVEAGVPGAGQSVTSQNRGGEYRGTVTAQFPMDRNGVVSVSQGDGPRVQIGFNLWNNGTRTWGDARLVLVNEPPQNLRRAVGWETLYSIPGDRQRVEPGTGTNIRFHVNPEELNRPGWYPFRFRVLDRASGEYIPGVEPSFVLKIDPACYTAAVVAQSVSPLTAAGTSGQFEFALKNTGACTWQAAGPNPVRLGTKNPQDGSFRFADGSWLGSNRVPLAEASVAPGQVGHFRATFRVPPGTPASRLRQYFAPVAEGKQWFGSHLGAYLDWFVGDAWHLPWYPWEYGTPWVTQTYVGHALAPGDTATVKVTYRNLGPAVLFSYGPHPVHLRGIREQDRESGFIDRTSPLAVGSNQAQGVRMDQDRVNPGELFSFTLPIRVLGSLKPGTYIEYFRPVAEGLFWFGSDKIFWPFTVTK